MCAGSLAPGVTRGRVIGEVLITMHSLGLENKHRLCDSALARHVDNQACERFLYIMTLGVSDTHRRCGVASRLIDACKASADADSACGGLYLHVITYNAGALAFYGRHGFYCVSQIADYYTIDGRKYDAYLLLLPKHGLKLRRGLLARGGEALTWCVPHGDSAIRIALCAGMRERERTPGPPVLGRKRWAPPTIRSNSGWSTRSRGR